MELEVNPYPGLFIDIEGVDGCGSTTQIDLIAKMLQERGLRVNTTEEPWWGLIGSLIRKTLAGEGLIDRTTLQVLFVADRLHHLESYIIPQLKEGTPVFTDRYLWSTLAYAEPDDRGYVYLLHQHPRIILPDLTIFLEVPPRECLDRITQRQRHSEIYEEKGELIRVWQGYQELADRFPGNIRVVDGLGDRPVVAARIIETMNVLPKFQALTKSLSLL